MFAARALRLARTRIPAPRHFSTTKRNDMKVRAQCGAMRRDVLLSELHQVLAVLYQGFDAAKEEPRLLGTVENEVSLPSPPVNSEIANA
jgi:hypothetical protein